MGVEALDALAGAADAAARTRARPSRRDQGVTGGRVAVVAVGERGGSTRRSAAADAPGRLEPADLAARSTGSTSQ